MDISNRALALLAVSAFALSALAVLMTIYAVPVSSELPPPPSDRLQVMPAVTRSGGTPIEAVGPLIVRLQPGQRARTAHLGCDLFKAERRIYDGFVDFPSLPLGDCALTLQGARTGFGPVFPGDRLRCRIEEGATVCEGGLATSRAARVSVTSDVPGELRIDGMTIGPVPRHDLPLTVGRRRISLHYADGRYVEWPLTVRPDERVSLRFPVPPGLDPSALPPVSPPPPPAIADTVEGNAVAQDAAAP